MNAIDTHSSLAFAARLTTINDGGCTDLDLHDAGLMIYNSTNSSFNQLEVVVKVNNIHSQTDPARCQTMIPLTVVTQAAPARMNDGPCRPYCSPLIQCNYVPDGKYNQIQDGSMSYDIARYFCECPGLCNDFGVYLPPSAAQNPSYNMQICSVLAKPFN